MPSSSMEPSAALRWVKLRSMQVFWPACVYRDYSEAVAHTHDVWALRASKPVLDAEDNVVYFFGVGPRACHVAGAGAAPNLQLCVAHTDDITSAPWRDRDEFEELCHEQQIAGDLVARAAHNACFLRACEEAAAFRDVQTDEQAGELFIAILKGAKRVHRTDKSVMAREIKELKSPETSPVKATGKKDSNQEMKQVARVLKKENMQSVVAKCWQQMLASGWETMTQGDGHVLYKMPGTSFMDFQPNVNFFDSMEKACARYLRDWVQSVGNQSESKDFEEMTEFVWPMAVGSGWEAMASSSETLYKKADTPFDQWVPNVTIFRSKAQAVAKYLEECGLAGTSEESDDEASPEVYDAAGSDVNMEESEEEQASQSMDEESEAAEDAETEGSDALSESESEDNQDVHESPKKVRSSSRTRAKTTKKPAKKAQPQAATTTKKVVKTPKANKKPKKPQQPMPKFNLPFGKIERALKELGWYWRYGGLHYNYFQPYCKGKKKEDLKENKDYFSRENLEMYLESSGLQAEIEKKLYEEHCKEYAPESEEEDEEDEDLDDISPAELLVSLATPKSSTSSLRKRSNGTASSVSVTGSSRSKSRSIASVAGSKRARTTPSSSQSSRFQSSRSSRARSKSSGRDKLGFASKTTLAEVKFGEIWSVLADDGWHYEPSIFDYNYFKPHCETTADGEPGVDYFINKEQLEEYLYSSGLWDRTAKRVRALAAADSEDEDISDSDDEVPTPSQKREREEVTPAQPSRSKKSKTLFETPTVGNRADFSEDEDTISPEASTTKESSRTVGGPLSRNLVNSFTPSPGTARKGKSPHDVNMTPVKEPVKETTKELSPHQMIMNAIPKLSSGYTPANFRHREKEFEEICDFFRGCFDEEKKTSLYISGAPGCGKTALLKATESKINELYRECCPDQADKEPVRSHVNAMALADSKTLFCKLAETLTNKSFTDGNEAFDAIERATTRRLKSSRTMILILDEIDMLLKNNGIEDDLCRLFELAHRPSHSFILIGIANQVDFTERHLPLLKQRLPDCSPRVVIFEPYTYQTIDQILIQRLGGEATAWKMLSKNGIIFLARKIASTTGDIRLAVDICRRILQHKLDSCDKENAENGMEDQELARPMPLSDMLRVMKHALDSKSAAIISNLPRNLQMILFASTRLLILQSNQAAANGDKSSSLFSVDDLYSSYCDVSKEAGVFRPMGEREFRTGLDTLSSEGLIAQAEFKRHLIKLLFSTSELLQSFRKDAFFKRLV